MLDILRRAEAELPDLLLTEEGWKGLEIEYHWPYVYRVWRQFGDYRICLHSIAPCEPGQPLYHPHPWPSAMVLLRGTYEMCVGYGDAVEEPPHASRLILTAGSRYEMVHPGAWHSVRPISRSALTTMVTGQPWDREIPHSILRDRIRPLQELDLIAQLHTFREYYPG